MTSTRGPVTRRQLLGAVAGSGALFGVLAVGRAAADLDPVPLANSQQIQNGSGPDLLVEWATVVNGQQAAGSGFTGAGDDAPAGPAVQVGNVMPGDTGALVVRLSVAPGRPGRVTARFALGENAENGINEPESAAGDTTDGPDAGELADALQAGLWYDEGAMGLSGVGERNGTREPGESLVHPDASGSLRDVASAAGGGVVLAGRDGDCLGPNESVSVALGWSLPPETGNVVQTDSVAFDLTFEVEACAGGGQ
jgi:hypothetical protein